MAEASVCIEPKASVGIEAEASVGIEAEASVGIEAEASVCIELIGPSLECHERLNSGENALVLRVEPA